jgi:agmatinase
MRLDEMNLEGLPTWGGIGDQPTAERVPEVTIAGIPYDSSAFYRRGAAQAPERLRRLSAVMPPITETGKAIAVRLHDVGDAPLRGAGIEPNIEPIADWLIDHVRGVQVVLGGDHTVAIPSVVAQSRRYGQLLAVVTFDAHPDLCDVSHGSRYSHGCAIRRVTELASVPGTRLTMVGLRDFDAEELDFVGREGVNMITMAEASHLAGQALHDRLQANLPHGAAVHLSIDIDVLDPGFAPGTGIPSAGGASTRQVLDWLNALRDFDVVGLDLVEVAPSLDHGDITTLAALKIIFEFLGLLRGVGA